MTKKDPRQVAYENKLLDMARQFNEWLDAHPDEEPVITFNAPPKVCVITDLATALSNGVIRVDKLGQQMLDAMQWTAETPDQPSFMMVRAVIECVLEERAAAKNRSER